MPTIALQECQAIITELLEHPVPWVHWLVAFALGGVFGHLVLQWLLALLAPVIDPLIAPSLKRFIGRRAGSACHATEERGARSAP